jgi:hypothetical protein
MPKYCLGFRSSAGPNGKTVLNDEVVQDLTPARGELPPAEPGTAQRSMILVADVGQQRKNRIVREAAPAPCPGEIAIGRGARRFGRSRGRWKRRGCWRG